jgi:MYXO-CTERM domain-containing protein
MTRFRKAHRIRGIALAVGLLTVAMTSVHAAPIQFAITDIGPFTGWYGLDNDGNVIERPVRNIVGELTPTDHPISFGGGGFVLDGAGDGRLLAIAFGYGSESHVPHAFIYYPDLDDGRPTNFLLGSNDRAKWTDGADMNTNGEVVGSGEWGGVDGKRLFYNAAHSVHIQDLNDLIPPDSGWKLTDVYSINDHSQILGVGVNPQGETSAFLLTPAAVPEPGAWAVFGLAAAFAWRKRRAG